MLTITKTPTPTADPQDVALTLPTPTRPPRRLGPVAFMAAGLASIIAAGTLVAQMVTEAPTTAPAQPELAAAAPTTTVGLSDDVYGPGHSSTWHTHPGVHSVVVLEGTLTVYDETCTKQEIGPGGSYLGGREPHLVRNDTDTPVRLVVTFAFTQASTLDHAGAAPAPAGCAAR